MTTQTHSPSDLIDRWIPRVGTVGLLLIAGGLLALGFQLYVPRAPASSVNSLSVSEAGAAEISSP